MPISLAKNNAPMLVGGHLAFCSSRFSESSNFEQLDLKTAVDIINLMKKVKG